LHLVPTSGWGKPANYVLPVLTLGLNQAALLTRITRASVLDVNRQDFMRTARAKGLREHVLIRRHLLKNSMIPVVTVLGPLLAFLIVGSLVVENIFSVPGIGRLLVQGISQRDYSLIMGSTLVYAIVIAVLNLIVDVGYAFIIRGSATDERDHYTDFGRRAGSRRDRGRPGLCPAAHVARSVP